MTVTHQDGKREIVVTGLKRDLLRVEGCLIGRRAIENTITACQAEYKLELPLSGADAAVLTEAVLGASRLVLVLETAFDVLDESDPKEVRLWFCNKTKKKGGG